VSGSPAAQAQCLMNGLILAIRTCSRRSEGVRAAVIDGEGEALLLRVPGPERTERTRRGSASPLSRMWHAAWNACSFGPVPVIAALHGGCGRWAGAGQRRHIPGGG